MSYVVQGTVQINLITEGDLSGVVNVENLIINNTKSMAGAQAQMNQASSNGAYLIRRLAIDLRMFSSGITALRREYEGLNPLFDSFAQGLQVASAAALTTVAGVSAISDANRLLESSWLGAGSAAAGFSKIMTYTIAGLPAIAVALGALAGIVGGVFIGENITGITAFREEISKLQDQIESLDAALRNLGVEQAALNAEAAAYQAQLAQVNRQIELQGYATASQEAQVAALESAISGVKARQAENNAETSRATFENKQAASAAQDYQDAIDKFYQNLQTNLARYAWSPKEALVDIYKAATGQLGQAQMGGEVARTGPINVERGEVIMQKEQVASMLAGGGSGGYQVTISLAGAVIKNDVDLENGLRNGAKSVVRELEALEMRRRRVNTKF